MKRWPLVLFWSFYPVAHAADNPLNYLHSTRWQGGATIEYSDGSKENAKCVATYFIDQTEVTQNLRCATAATAVKVKTIMAVNGTNLSGEWSEESYNISGQVAGRIVAGGFNLQISSTLLTGTLTVATDKCSQHVTIQAPESMLRTMVVKMRKC